ncbi:amino acid adenylation domain-containing protein, partial [Hymenobacter rubripertinctus]
MSSIEFGAVNYWIEHLQDAKALRLPGVSAPADVAAEASTVSLPVSPADAAAIRRIAGDKDLNVLKLFLSGLTTVLWKYSHQDELLVSLPPLALPGNEGVPSGPLHCRLHLGGQTLIHELLGQVHETLNTAHKHRHYDEAALNQEYVRRTGSLAPLRGVGLSYSRLREPGTWLTEHELLVEIVEQAETCISISCRSGAYPAAMLRDMAESLLQVVLGLSMNKNKALAACDVIPPHKLAAWSTRFENNTRPYPQHVTVIDLFLESVARHPGKTALVYGETVLTYAELAAQAEEIAAMVTAQTGGPGALVGVLMDRSALLVATITGILWAGAAYVPIDKEYPAERVRDIVADANLTLILTDADDVVSELPGCQLVNLAGIGARVGPIALALPRPTDLAYVIYSSGTTGKPKGIMIEHAAIMNLLFWYNERYAITDDTRIVQLTKSVIDIAFQEIYSALMNGLTLYVPIKEESQDKDSFLGYLRKYRINFIQVIPDTLAEYFLDSPRLDFLDYLLCGGDRLTESLKDAILAKGYTLFNVYGQTETAIDTVGALCQPGTVTRFDEFVPNYDLLIVDEYGLPCPDFVTGEICTGGSGLARGYLNQPALTADKFVGHPLKPGQRLYRTGDLARRLPEGSIELMGRQDDQLKIRGQRVELSEIEFVLHEHPEIADAVLKVNESGGEKQIHAFLVSRAATGRSAGEFVVTIQAYLLDKLPAYMIPVRYHVLDKLPLTANGKVDKKRLSTADSGWTPGVQEYVGPRNETEATLIGLWQQLLGRETIGVKDNFFDLGGHSLKAMRLISQIRKAFEVKMELKKLFAFPVLEDQARLIGDAVQSAHQSLQPAPVQPSYLLSSSQQRVWVLSQFEQGNAAHNMPGIYLFEKFDLPALEQSFAALLERHEILRTVFRENEQAEIRQYVLPAAEAGFRVAYQDLRGQSRPAEYLKSLVPDVARHPFDLAAGPLMRAAVYQIADAQWVLVFVMHHIISDGWSMEILTNELKQLFQANLKGEPARLVPLPIQYKDYAVWQRGLLSQGAFEPHKAYWLGQLQGELPTLELPARQPRPAMKTYNGAMLVRQIGSVTTRQLRALVQQEESTLFMGLLAVVNALLHRYTGQEDIIIGTPIAGREHADLENQIGFYLNTLALRSRFSGSDSFRDVLAHTRQITLDAYEHQAYPFDELIEALRLPRNMSRSALFDVMLVLQNTELHAADAQPDDVKISPYAGMEHRFSKFDLIFNFTEVEDALEVAIEYNLDILEAPLVAQLANHLAQLLDALLLAPDQAIGTLEYLSESERAQQLEVFN